ncbi:hypothetical protein [Paenibacillus sp. IHB B 3415]|uniref:hypothetical protein n=1 Tax=Paenibacillus sp. IHB B 3415 TaxID=867080 RepID=UPI00128C2DDE|nr:hypothetical protein [Paenibacillus sp. IHB B 3415]
MYVSDLLNFIIPTSIEQLNGDVFHGVAQKFTGNDYENNAYLGIPVIILWLFAVQYTWNSKLTRMFSVVFAIICILSMGSNLHVLGFSSIELPWRFIEYLPLIKHALPSRLMLYADIILVLTIMLAYEKLLRLKESKKYCYIVILCLVLNFIFWLPVQPFPYTTKPEIFKDVQSGAPILSQIDNEPTVILTDTFSGAMQLLVDTGYSFPVSNVYGFASADASLINYRTLLNYKSENISEDFIASAIGRLNVGKVLYLPVHHQMSPDVIESFNKLLGIPLIGDNGAMLWSVPLNLSYTAFSGDIYVLDKQFEPNLKFEDWAGEAWNVKASKQSVNVTLKAPAYELMQSGISIETTYDDHSSVIKLGPGESKTITISNESVKFRALKTFIPDEIIGNNDTRKLSCLIQLDIIK